MAHPHDPQETDTPENQYRKEVEHLIGIPFRVKLYVDARLKGMSVDQALAIARDPRKTG